MSFHETDLFTSHTLQAYNINIENINKSGDISHS
jgi:hypothetical protein